MVLKSVLVAALIFTWFTACADAQVAGSSDFLKTGNALVSKERYNEAITEYMKIGPGQREYSQSLYNIGVCYYELLQTYKAISYYQQALSISRSSYPRASYALGVALEDLGKTSDAKTAYLQATRSEGSPFAPALFKLGVINAIEGEFKIAADLFRRATHIPGEHAAASHNNLGVMLARMGRLTEAEKEFLVALGQTGGAFTDAKNNLALCRELLTTARTDKTPANLEFTIKTF